MRFTLALFLVLFAGVSTFAQESTPQTEPVTTGGSITGRVVSDSGQPLANATVFFRSVGAVATRTTTSDADGNFRVNGLDSGLYNFSASLATFVGVPRDPESPPVYYRIGDAVRIELMKGGVVTGTVVNQAGEPVIAIRVRAIRIRDANGKPAAGVYATGERTTDDRGIYRIYGLVPGTYIVQAGGGALQFQPSAFDFDAPTYSPSATRDTAAEVTVRSGEESTADIRYRAEPGHTVSGTVKRNGENANGVNVSMTIAGSDALMPTGYAFQNPGTRGFAFYGIADGDYDLIAREILSRQQNQQIPDLALSMPKRITVKGGDINGIELATVPLAKITGKFVFEASKLVECQNKRRPILQEMTVTLIRNPQKDDQTRLDWANVRVFGQTSFPDKEGAFVLRNLSTGQYTFAPKFFARYWYVQSMSIGGSPSARYSSSRVDAARNWTTIKGGESITGLMIVLTEGAASIRGRLSLAEGTQAPANLKVYLVPADRDKADESLRYFVADIGGDGSFMLTNLPPGNYLAAIQTPGDRDPQTLEKLRLPDAAEARLKIRRAAEAAKVTIELKPCQNLTDYKLPWSAQ